MFAVRKESACRASEESGMGFCLPTDRLSSQCVGRMAVAQQSVDCGSDEWCCQRSGRRFKSLLKKAGGQRSVDDAPCGHGNTINRLLFGSAASGNIRRFARIFNGNPVDEADVCWVVSFISVPVHRCYSQPAPAGEGGVAVNLGAERYLL